MRNLILIFSLVLLSGCATEPSRLFEDGGGFTSKERAFGIKSVGNSDIKEIGKYRNIKEGISMKKDIYDEFGQPSDVDISDVSKIKWIYYYSTISFSAKNWIPFYGIFDGGSNHVVSTAEFIFDTENTLIELDTSERQGQTKFHETFETGKWDQSYIDKVETEMVEMGLPFDLKQAQRLFGIAEID